MLQVTAQFPFPGSTVLFDDKHWRVLRHNLDGTALLARDAAGTSGQHLASFNREAPVDELIDPSTLSLPTGNLSDRAVRTLAWLDRTLRTANLVDFNDLKAQLANAAHNGDAPGADGYQLAGLMRRLGWKRVATMRANLGTARIWERDRRPQPEAIAA